MITIVISALSALIVVLLALLLVGLFRPSSVGRLIPWIAGREPSRQRATAILAPALAGAVVLLVVVMALPRFEVSLPPGEKVVAGESKGLGVAIRNAAVVAKPFEAVYSLDGTRQSDVTVHIPGRETAEVDLPLPADLAPGEHTVLVGDQELTIRALRPAAFSVTELGTSTKIARTGDRVRVSADVTNTGEVPGEFDGELRMNGARFDAKPCTIDPGASRDLEFTVHSKKQGKHRLRLGDATRTIVVVKPVRYANGYYLRRTATGGRGQLRVKNGNNMDAVVVLTRTSAPRKPVISCYLKARRSFTVTDIPDGSYRVFYVLGKDWNTHTDGFLTVAVRRRFNDVCKFTTKTWTTSWSDSTYRYTQGHARYTVWRISLNPVAGGKGRASNAPENEFPKAR